MRGPSAPGPLERSAFTPATATAIRKTIPTTHEYAPDGRGALDCSTLCSAASSAASPAASRSAALGLRTSPKSPKRSSATGGRAALPPALQAPRAEVAQGEALVLLGPHQRRGQHDHHA